MNNFLICILLMLSASPALANNVSIQIVKDAAATWHFHNVRATAKHVSTDISGRITGPNISSGHIDISAQGPDGNLIAHTTSKPAVLTYRSKRKGGALFNAHLKQNLPEGTIIKVAFHQGELSCQHQNTAQ